MPRADSDALRLGAVGTMAVRAEGSGDDALVAAVEALAESPGRLVIITSDRELRDRVTAATDGGAAVRGARWLLNLLDES